MKTYQFIAWINLAVIIILILDKGIQGMFNSIGKIGGILITVAIIAVLQKKS